MTKDDWEALFDRFGFILDKDVEVELMHGDWLENNAVEEVYIGTMYFEASELPDGPDDLRKKREARKEISPGLDSQLITKLRRRVAIFQNARDAIAFKLKWT